MAPTVRMVLQPRFINNEQLSISVVYDYIAGNNLKATQYVLTAPGASYTGMSFLGLGDSFAAGQGAFNYQAGTDTSVNTCHLSSLSYPFILSGSLFAGGRSVACSGAVTDDIINKSRDYRGQSKDQTALRDRGTISIQEYLGSFTPGYLAQSDFIDVYRPEVITMSIGGNDIGFGNILKSCVSPAAEASSCYPAYEDQLELYKTIQSKFDRLVQTYKLVYKPGKRVYVVGYPQIAVPDGNCALNVHLDSREIALSISLIDYLNSTIAAAAKRVGVEYVDISQSLAGHRMCEIQSREVAVNGFTVGNDDGLKGIKFVGSESYHPNALGHAMMERTIRSATHNLSRPMPSPDTTARPPALPNLVPSSLLPQTGRTVRTTVSSENLTQDVLVRGQTFAVKTGTNLALLKPLTSYTAELHSEPTQLGVIQSTANGELDGLLSLPATISPGFHVLHIYGLNMANQPVDIYQTVYVAASETDYNGDGILNGSDWCEFVPAANQDADQDGNDDACDPAITNAPEITARSFTATLGGNTIRIGVPQ
ncbi:MAG TPA: SGNH/GDSL hydrolase family protein, partial [Candidatus Limnocylindrales bacterium]|nr:SGNH/GDSL hydrolase family protein [Candidatus Limnocylindrales bacterium]